MNQGKLERIPVVIVTACMKARNSSERLEQWRDKKSIQIQLVTTQQYVIGYKTVCSNQK